MKKFQYVTSLLATLGMLGGMSNEAWAQGVGGDKDESLPPIVMIVLDTSTSMWASFETGNYRFSNGTNYYGPEQSRLTKALAEIAGAPKVDKQTVVKASGKYLPRSYKYCKNNKCSYESKCFPMYDYIANLPNHKTSSSACESYKKSFYNDYHENGVLHSYMYSVKFGFAGFCSSSSTYLYGRDGELTSYDKSLDDSGWRFGVKISDSYKTSSSSKAGIFTADPRGDSPTIYPTVSDDSEEIYNSNKAVITTIRGYNTYSGTPIGPALADLYYMFTTPDPGIIAQPISNYEGTSTDFMGHTGLIGTVDTKYECRDKGVILISDGEPGTGVSTSGAKGQSSKVWEDARRLSDAGIKVYSIAYGQAGGDAKVDPNKTTLGSVMNKVAWQGGTCRNKNGDIIDPDDSTGYNNMLKESNVSDRICFYNADDSDALRSALVTALSDMLQGTVSKTSIATTTAIGQKHNVHDGVWNNGYYNVYSGYNITMGPVRRTVLQRKAVMCAHTKDDIPSGVSGEAGMFYNDPNQFLDLTKRLECRLRGSGEDGCGKLDGTGYITDSVKGCLDRGSDSDHPDPIEGSENDCLDERYIFTAKYYDDGNDISRYAISTFDGSNKEILENVSILDLDVGHAGMLPKALNSEANGEIGKASDANFLLRNNSASEGQTCADEMAKSIYDQVGMANYSLSPYECKEAFDCGETSGGIPRLCDLGRCVEPDAYERADSCTSNDGASGNKVCVGKYWRSINQANVACNTHNDCLRKNIGLPDNCIEGHCVCHAGYCIPGTIKSCDVRQFMASVPLGTIEYATPVPVEPPTKAYKSMAYRKFSTKYWRRDLMLMVGANDGMLHAFILGDNIEAGDYKSSGTYDTSKGLSDASKIKLPGHPGLDADNREGDELWGFIPKMAYKDLYKLPNFGTQYFVNTKPAVADVQLPGITIDGDSWRTVLVGGFREGGRGYYALDITNPAKPFVLWEIDHQWQPWTSDVKYPDIYENLPVTISEAISNRAALEQDKGFPFQLMGYSYSEPVITNLMIGDTVEPVAILAGGRSSSSDDLYDQVGKALYIVRLFPKSKEDLLVKTFYFDSMVTGSPALFPNNFNGVTQHIYVGDAKGALYRLDVSSKNINEWGSRLEGSKVEYTHINAKADDKATSTSSFPFEHEVPVFNPSVMTDLGNQSYQPITFKPAVSLLGYVNSIYPTVQITYGTGSNDTFSVNNKERHYVATFVDVPDPMGIYQLNASSSPCFDPKIILFNSDLNRTGSLVTDNHLGQQQYRVYTKDPVSNAELQPFQKMTGAPITHNFVSYFPSFVMNEGANNNCATGGANLWYIKGRKTCSEITDYLKPKEDVQNAMNNEAFLGSSRFLGEGTKVYGLEITNQMYCIADEGGKNHVLAPQLIAQTGAETAVVHTDDGSAALNSGKVNIQSLAINLEAFQPEVSRVTWAGVYE